MPLWLPGNETHNKRWKMEKRLVHDYPRLAKESGFNFCFRFKRVNWSKLDELDVEEIAFRGKYEQLEESIDLILNCDLDEDVTKVLDKNFVKLFRLAQISVGYLRHCLLYLDQCVVLLQDKLSNALQQTTGVNILAKNEKDGFECEKCQKVFLTTSYLHAHQKRRHSSPEKTPVKSVSTQTEPTQSLTINTGQQTDPTRTFPASTQTNLPKMFEKGVMTEVGQEKNTSNEYEGKLDTVLKRLEAVEAKSEQPSNPPEANDENKQILQYLQNLMPLLSAHKEEKNAVVREPLSVTVDTPTTKKDEPLLIDLDLEPLTKPEKTIEEIVKETVSEESPNVNEKQVEKPRPRRKKIASPLETSEEEESMQLPVPKPRVTTAFSHEKREALIVEKEKPRELVQEKITQNSPTLITFSAEKDIVPIKTTPRAELTLTEKIDRKMRELGLDPEWTRIPDESFRNVSSVLQHQMQKNPTLARLRHNLELKLENMTGAKKETLIAENKPIMYDTDSDGESEDDRFDTQVQEISPYKPTYEKTTTATIEYLEEKSPIIAPEIQAKQTTFPTKQDHAKSSAFAVKTTDLSIFQVAGNGKQEKAETDSEESEPIKIIKSSLLIKNKDEPKKRVVFADNFVLETIHNELLDVDNQSSSSSNSWDIQTP